MFQSYRNQSVDLQSKSTDLFLYDGNIGRSKVKIGHMKNKTNTSRWLRWTLIQDYPIKCCTMIWNNFQKFNFPNNYFKKNFPYLVSTNIICSWTLTPTHDIFSLGMQLLHVIFSINGPLDVRLLHVWQLLRARKKFACILTCAKNYLYFFS